MSKVFKGIKKVVKGIGRRLKKVVKRVGKVLKKMAPVIGIAMMFIPGMQGWGAALGKAIGLSGTAATVVGSAIVQGTASGIAAYANGGKFGKGFVMGAAAGAAGAGVGAMGKAAGWSQGVTKAATGATVAGIKSKGDPRAMVAGAAGGYLAGEYPEIGGSKIAGSVVRGGVVGGIMGGSEGATRGAILGGVGAAVQPVAQQVGDAAWDALKQGGNTVKGWFTGNDTTQEMEVGFEDMASTMDGNTGNTTDVSASMNNSLLTMQTTDNRVLQMAMADENDTTQNYSTGGYVKKDDMWKTLDIPTLQEVGRQSIDSYVQQTTSPTDAMYSLTRSFGTSPESLYDAVVATESVPEADRIKVGVMLGERLGSGNGVVVNGGTVTMSAEDKVAQLRAVMPKPPSNMTASSRVMTPEEQNLDELITKRNKTQAPTKMTADWGDDYSYLDTGSVDVSVDTSDWGVDSYTADEWSDSSINVDYSEPAIVDDGSGSNLDGTSYTGAPNTELLDAGINPNTPQGQQLLEQNVDGDIGQIDALDKDDYSTHLQVVRENYEMGSDLPVEGFTEQEQTAMSSGSSSGGTTKSGTDWKKLASGALNSLAKAAEARRQQSANKLSTYPDLQTTHFNGASISGASGKGSVDQLGSRWTTLESASANQYLAQLLAGLKVA